MAHEMGLKFDQMTCIATPVKLQRSKKSVKELSERVKQALVDFKGKGQVG